ncbi:MAG: MFS transporter [Deltaproteobacteria bacterium]|nr:MFS transporter [Deltaproteobacteria bacterium]MBI3390757.1 MFS transporter [Deltaproteobacteria bacterium]
MPDRDVAATFVRWTFMRAIFHRGWWLVTSLYLVVDANLSPFQLVFIGTAQGLTALAFEIPTGVMADTISRKWSIVIAHLVMGTGMLVTGLVTTFPALVATQMLWGLAWTFSSGADVAWLTDELDRPERTAAVLTASARWEQVGAATGLVGFGALAWATNLATSIVVSGLAMLALGLFVVARFTEHHFTPTREHRWRKSVSIFRRGVDLARRDHEILLVFAATILVNGAAEAFGRLFPKRLVELGFPERPAPIVWLTALGLVTLAVGALALRIVEARIDGVGVGRRVYSAACIIGALGLIVLAVAPDDITAMAGVLLVSGISLTVTRCVSVIWVNRRATSDVRATVQSFLAQAEYFGEISLGIALGILAQATSIAVAMMGSCALIACAGALVVRSRAER